MLSPRRSKLCNGRWLHVLAGLMALMCGARGLAQSCEPYWLPGHAIPGADGPVHAIMSWDSDGEGPLEAALIVGGDFLAIGDIRAARVAAWDGRQWQQLGAGFNDQVLCLGTFNGELVAGGKFTHAGDVQVNRIARWDADSKSWQPLAAGMFSGAVHAVIEHDGQLVAGGAYSMLLGSTWTLFIARYNGQSWQPMGTLGAAVNALTIYNGMLVAGGKFTDPAAVALWDGDMWQPVGDGAHTNVQDLVTVDGFLMLGANDWSSGFPQGYVARFDGTSWQQLGPQFTKELHTLAIHQGQLFASVSVQGPQGSDEYVVRWNEASWEPIGGDFNRQARTLATFDGELIVGGDFDRNGARAAYRLARLDSSQQIWKPLVVTPVLQIGPFAEHHGNWMAAGRFMDDDGVATHSIAQWDAQSQRWHPLGPEIEALALAVYQGDLIAGGAFTMIDGVPINRVARWDGDAWQPLGPGIQDGVNPQVNALIQFGDELIATGTFATAGGVPVNNIARWNGAMKAWQSMGSGLQPPTDDIASGRALAVFDDQLVVGGYFAKAGGLNASCIARWDGAAWSPLGSGLNGSVHNLLVHHNQLLACGSFGGSAKYIARWDNNAWQPMVQTASNDGSAVNVNALAIWRNELIAGGLFTMIDGMAAQSIVRWNGSAWQPLDGGVSGANVWINFGWRIVEHLGVRDDALFVGGRFSTAGEQVSFRAARAVRDGHVADLNCDSVVNVLDLLTVIDMWGACPSLPDICSADVSPAPAGDGVVDVLDLLTVIENWN